MAADRDGKLNRFFGWCLPAKWRVAVIDTWTRFEREFSLSFRSSFIYSFHIDRSIDGRKILFKIDLFSFFFFFFFLGTKYISGRDWNFNRSNINSCWRIRLVLRIRWAVILRSKSGRVKFSFARGDRSPGIQIFEITELYSYISGLRETDRGLLLTRRRRRREKVSRFPSEKWKRFPLFL